MYNNRIFSISTKIGDLSIITQPLHLCSKGNNTNWPYSPFLVSHLWQISSNTSETAFCRASCVSVYLSPAARPRPRARVWPCRPAAGGRGWAPAGCWSVSAPRLTASCWTPPPPRRWTAWRRSSAAWTGTGSWSAAARRTHSRSSSAVSSPYWGKLNLFHCCTSLAFINPDLGSIMFFVKVFQLKVVKIPMF